MGSFARIEVLHVPIRGQNLSWRNIGGIRSTQARIERERERERERKRETEKKTNIKFLTQLREMDDYEENALNPSVHLCLFLDAEVYYTRRIARKVSNWQYIVALARGDALFCRTKWKHRVQVHPSRTFTIWWFHPCVAPVIVGIAGVRAI